MTNYTNFVLGLYVYSSSIKDTLEYVMNKKEYSAAAYEARKQTLAMGLTENQPLRKFLDQNPEKGPEIEKNINTFINDFYSPNSTIIRVNNNEVRVDHAMHIRIFETVIGLHETLTDILRGYEKTGKEQNLLEDRIKNLLSSDERLYRAILLHTLMIDYQKLFMEFNQEMRESQGKETPQSKFTQEEIKKYVGFFNFIKAHTTLVDEEALNVFDAAQRMVEYTTGRRALPSGKTFEDMFKEYQVTSSEFLKQSEAKWLEIWRPIVIEIQEFAKANQTKSDA
ncbi:MAG: hypothetical protein LBR37_02675 [Erysipelotrichaceae bacterium]|jgi:hypothetical protein|nr:hypothetical protein [Erysipelotrichaceae bacterium]